MNRLLSTLLVSGMSVLTLVGCQRGVDIISGDPAPASATAPVIVSTDGAIPTGTNLRATLNERLSTSESEVNDPVMLTLESPVLNAQRETLIPAGARIQGRITGLRGSRDAATPAAIRIELQSITWNGRTAPLAARIVEADPRIEGRGTDEALRGAAAGAAAGAVLGAILDRDVGGALTGAAVGAGAGTLISLGTADAAGVLEAGSTMTLELTEPLPAGR